MSSVGGVNSEVFTWKKNVTLAAVGLIGITALVVGILFLQGHIGQLPPTGLPPAAIPLMGVGGALLGADILALIILSVLACTCSNNKEQEGIPDSKTQTDQTSAASVTLDLTGIENRGNAFGTSEEL